MTRFRPPTRPQFLSRCPAVDIREDIVVPVVLKRHERSLIRALRTTLLGIMAICLPAPLLAQSIFPVRQGPIAGGPTVGNTVELQGRVEARCRLTLASAVQSISVSMVDGEGRINGVAFQAAIVDALNQAGLKGWCSGANNELVLTRTPFVLGSDGNPVNGFARAVLFDVAVSVSAVSQSYSDATQDGPTAGSTAGRFGPTGEGAEFSFAAPLTSGSLPQPIPVIAASSVAQGATASFTQLLGSRLVAGNYVSSVTLEVRPGL
jgi:hypothetical protein